MKRLQNRYQAADIIWCAAVANIEIPGCNRRPLENGPDASDYDEFNSSVLKTHNNVFNEVREHRTSLQQSSPSLVMAQTLHRRHTQHFVDERIIEVASMAKVK